MSIEERISNLKNRGTLKDAARDEELIKQYLTNAENFRADADRVSSAVSRFNLAYEGLHALAMAFLTDRSVRTDGEGHRSAALQLSMSELTINSKLSGVEQAVIQIHQARNNTTYYRPIPPISDSLAAAALKLLDAALAGAKNQIQFSTSPAPK